MVVDLLGQLKAIDQTVLTEIVRKDQHDPHLEIIEWMVEPICHEIFTNTTAGLFCFQGEAQGVKGKPLLGSALEMHS